VGNYAMAGMVMADDDVQIGVDLVFAWRYPAAICWCLARHPLRVRFN
jgi:hypothetical protein